MTNPRFDVQKNIINNMPVLIDAFTEFYGEDHRKEIEAKFGNLIINGYFSIGGLDSVITSEKKKIADECLDEFKEETGIKDQKMIDAIFGYISDFTYIPLIVTLTRDLSENEVYQNQALTFLREFSGIQLTSLDDPKAKEVMETAKKLVPFIEKLVDRFDKRYDEEIKPYADYLEKIKSLEKGLRLKYEKEYLHEISDLLSDKDLELLKSDDYSYNKYKMDCQMIYLGSGENSFNHTYIDAFSKESTELLNDSKTEEWQRISINRDKINYFKCFGIDHGSNIDDYMNDPKCVELIPDYALVDRIITTRKKYDDKLLIDLYSSIPHLKKQLDILDSHNLLSDNCFFQEVINEVTCIVDNYIEDGDEIKSKPILYFSGARDEEAYDCSLIHELNHVYELSILEINDKIVTVLCGWDIVHATLSKDEPQNLDVERDKRNYEMFNEVVNELIAQDICTILHKKGICISGELSRSKESSGTSYTLYLNRFVKDFYEEFKEDITKSRINGNIEHLFNVIGKENFEEYNNMLRDFTERFPGMKIYKLLDDVKNNIDNEDTRYYHECKRKDDELMEKFRENKQKYQEKEGKSI